MFQQEPKERKANLTTSILKGKQLLMEPNCRQSWAAFRKNIPLSDADFEQYYTASVEAFAEYVQTLPATRYSLYARPYGFLQLGIDRAIIATKLSLQAFQDTAALSPEQLSAEHQAELFAVFSAALVSDVGVIPQRFKILVKNRLDQLVPFDIYAGSFATQGKEYSFEFIEPELTDWHAPASLILAKNILAATNSNYKFSAFAWLTQHHHVLHLWYNLMLRLTPREEEMTRRTLCTLIPRSDAELMDKFLEEARIAKERRATAAVAPRKPLFVPPVIEDDEDMPPSEDAAFNERNMIKNRERVPGDSTHDTPGVTDATNTRILGSYGASYAPRLTQGLAFLRWLRTALQHGMLLLADEQASMVFRNSDGLVLVLSRLVDAFAKQTGTQLRLGDLIRDLQQLGVSSSENLTLKSYVLKTSKGNRSFQGITLDNPYLVYEANKLPPITLGLVTAKSVNENFKLLLKTATPLYESKLMPE